MKKILTWKKYHRWFGLVLSVFMLVFCVSGIILNHRSLFRDCELSRGWMPNSYHIKNFNNGIIKGTTSTKDGFVVAFGGTGVWLTDRQAKHWTDFNAGLPNGADNRNIRNVVQTKDGTLWMATQYDVYRHDGKLWHRVELPGNEERISDITLAKDSSQIVALSRSKIYVIDEKTPPTKGFSSKVTKPLLLKAPKGYTPQTTLFKTIWKLHSGEYFGMTGRLVVDAIAIVMILLSITGIILFFLPYGIRRKKHEGKKDLMRKMGKQMAWNQKWHNKIGYATIILTLWLAISGMCLRPPLMIPLVTKKTAQAIEDGNVWQDKLRAIRWDNEQDCWLVSTTDGFLKVDKDFHKAPVLYDKKKAPSVSPMGITVFSEISAKGDAMADSTQTHQWFVGSFSGLYRWNPQTGEVVDAFTGKPNRKKSMHSSPNAVISGYSDDLLDGKSIIFDYAKGAQILKPNNDKQSKLVFKTDSAPINMPEIFSHSKMSLWNVALELHVGRCYKPFLGPVSDLFVFLSGLLISLVLLSGYIILYRQKMKRKNKNKKNKSNR